MERRADETPDVRERRGPREEPSTGPESLAREALSERSNDSFLNMSGRTRDAAERAISAGGLPSAESLLPNVANQPTTKDGVQPGNAAIKGEIPEQKPARARD